jgi:hypothetical protein
MDKNMQTQEKRGLGIKDIRKLNISLLCKWWWRLDKEEGLWQKIVKFKYLKNYSIHSVKHKQSDFAIWADLLKIKDIYLQGRIIWLRMVKILLSRKIHGCMTNLYISYILIFLNSVSNQM